MTRPDEEPTPREEFEHRFGPISDDAWQWLKEFCQRNYIPRSGVVDAWEWGETPVMREVRDMLPPGTRLPSQDEIMQLSEIRAGLVVSGFDRGYALSISYPDAPEGMALYGLPVRPGPVGITVSPPPPPPRVRRPRL